MASILVVEDNEDLAALLVTIIDDEGHEIRVATNGREALDEVAVRMPDVILLDMRMPVMNGREFMTQFRQDYGQASRIIVMTAAESAAARAREVDADAWLAKPFHPREVVSLLRRYAQPPRHSSAAVE